jgi:hypothetical protein
LIRATASVGFVKSGYRKLFLFFPQRAATQRAQPKKKAPTDRNNPADKIFNLRGCFYLLANFLLFALRGVAPAAPSATKICN